MQVKLAEYHNVPIIPIPNISRFNTSFKFPSYEIKVEESIETDNPKIKNIPTTLKFPTIKRQKRFISSNDSFSSVLDKLAAGDESIAKNKDILSRLAQIESNQRWNARNDRAYGAFQLMDFNITGDVNDFINNPEEQIRQANRLLEFNKSQFTKKDLELAQKQGYSYDQLLAGAWLGGVGSVRKVLTGTGNPSDKDGADVRSRMQKFQQGGVINKWLDDWNKARYNTGRFNDQLGNNQINIQKYNRDTTPVFHSNNERDKALDITNPIAQRYYNSNIGIVDTNPIRFKGGFYDQKDNFIQVVSPKQREYLENKFTSRLSNQQNQYEYMSPEWQQIEAQKKEISTIFKNNNYDSQLLHEQSHASKAIPQESKISTMIPIQDEYLDDPSEIYSRLNQLRQYYKLDPNKIYQKSDIKKLKGPSFDILNRYDDKTVLRLLNEVANNNTKPELVNYAQEGIKLSKEKLELIDRLRKQGQTYIKTDNSTKELKEANKRARKQKQIGENIKSIALNTAEGVASLNPYIGTALAIKNAVINPTSGYIDVASMILPQTRSLVKPLSQKLNKYIPKISSVDKKIPKRNDIDQSIQREIDDFYNTITDESILEKIRISDREFGTNYEDAVNILKKQYEETGTLFNYVNSDIMEIPKNASGVSALLIENYQKNPLDPTAYIFNVRSNRGIGTTGHELRHLFEKLENTIRATRNGTIENLVDNAAKIDGHLSFPRLNYILENNKVDFETFKDRVKKKYGAIEDSTIENWYSYYSDDDEFDSFLQDIISYRQQKGLSPIIKYDNLEQFEQDLGGVYNINRNSNIYNYISLMVKDPQKLLDKLNKYGWSVMLPLYLNKLRENENNIQYSEYKL